MKTSIKFLLVFVLTLSAASCSSDDSEDEKSIFVSYEPDSTTMLQGTSSISAEPVIYGEGPFEFSLKATPSTEEISINSKGVISATNQLPPGTYNVEVMVRYESGALVLPFAYSIEVLSAE